MRRKLVVSGIINDERLRNAARRPSLDHRVHRAVAIA
jgi:hypothetical protein